MGHGVTVANRYQHDHGNCNDINWSRWEFIRNGGATRNHWYCSSLILKTLVHVLRPANLSPCALNYRWVHYIDFRKNSINPPPFIYAHVFIIKCYNTICNVRKKDIPAPLQYLQVWYCLNHKLHKEFITIVWLLFLILTIFSLFASKITSKSKDPTTCLGR